MIVGPISSRYEVIAQSQRRISNNEYMLIFVEWRGIARDDTSLFQFLRRCQVQIGGVDASTVDGIGQLNLVDLQIAAHHGQHQPPTRYIADCFHRLCFRDVKESCQVGNCHTARCIDLLQCCCWLFCKLSPHKFGLFHVCCIVAFVAHQRIVLTRLGNGDKLLRVLATNRPTIGMNDDETQTTTCEDSAIGFAHLAIADIEALGVGIKTIEVLHQKFACAQQPSAWTRLVTELCLKLVDELRQVTIAMNEVDPQQSNNRLVRRAEHHISSLAVFQTEQHRSIHLHTARSVGKLLLPDIPGVHDRHGELLPTCPIHLLTHDLRNLANDTLAQRQEAIHSCCQLAYKASSHQEFLVATLRVVWDLAQRRCKLL